MLKGEYYMWSWSANSSGPQH